MSVVNAAAIARSRSVRCCWCVGSASEACQPFRHIIAPLNYLPFLSLLQRAFLVVTSSGDIQKDVPALVNGCLSRVTQRNCTEQWMLEVPSMVKGGSSYR